MSDLKDSVLVMRRIPEAPVLTAETLACLPGSYGPTAGSGTSGSDSMRGDGSSNAGDETSSSLTDDDMAGGNGGSGGRMELSKMFFGADHVASWMSNNASAYIDMCMFSSLSFSFMFFFACSSCYTQQNRRYDAFDTHTLFFYFNSCCN